MEEDFSSIFGNYSLTYCNITFSQHSKWTLRMADIVWPNITHVLSGMGLTELFEIKYC